MRMVAWVQLLRPAQWLKNLMVFFPPFLSGSMLQLEQSPWFTLMPFVAFCFASSSGYIFNDIVDHSRDASHPEKKHRPLPSKRITVPSAVFAAVVLGGAAIGLSCLISSKFLLFLIMYMGMTLSYSLFLKDVVVLDIFCISLGFVLRLYGGGEAFGVVISDWLFLSVFLLSIFLSVGKRYSERKLLGGESSKHRRVLEEYPEGFLEGVMYLSGAAVLVTYSMYAIVRPGMVYTVPFCAFGLLRYLLRIKGGESGDPTESLLKDLPLLVTGVIWVVLVSWSIYS